VWGLATDGLRAAFSKRIAPAHGINPRVFGLITEIEGQVKSFRLPRPSSEGCVAKRKGELTLQERYAKEQTTSISVLR
jgi:hypothetical protein